MAEREKLQSIDRRDIGEALLLVFSVALIFIADSWTARLLAAVCALIVVLIRTSQISNENKFRTQQGMLHSLQENFRNISAAVTEQLQAFRLELASFKKQIEASQRLNAVVSQAVAPPCEGRNVQQYSRSTFRFAISLVLLVGVFNICLYLTLRDRLSQAADLQKALEVRLSTLQQNHSDRLEAVASLADAINSELSASIVRGLAVSCDAPSSADEIPQTPGADLSQARAQYTDKQAHFMGTDWSLSLRR